MVEVVLEWTAPAAPVQAEGTFDGLPIYFRARWDHWSVGIGGSDPAGDPLWYYEEPYGKPDGYDASYMPQDEAHAFILAAIERYRAEQA